MLKIWGRANSLNVQKAMWAVGELGIAHERIDAGGPFGGLDTEEFGERNPNRRVPVIDDDGLIVWESMAINLYLADRYGAPPIWPATPRERAHVYQWSIWSQTEVDRPDVVLGRLSKNPERVATARRQQIDALAILDAALATRPYLLGDVFSLADLNVAATLSEPHERGTIANDASLDPLAHGLDRLGGWLARCTSRASWRKVAAFE